MNETYSTFSVASTVLLVDFVHPLGVLFEPLTVAAIHRPARDAEDDEDADDRESPSCSHDGGRKSGPFASAHSASNDEWT